MINTNMMEDKIQIKDICIYVLRRIKWLLIALAAGAVIFGGIRCMSMLSDREHIKEYAESGEDINAYSTLKILTAAAGRAFAGASVSAAGALASVLVLYFYGGKIRGEYELKERYDLELLAEVFVEKTEKRSKYMKLLDKWEKSGKITDIKASAEDILESADGYTDIVLIGMCDESELEKIKSGLCSVMPPDSASVKALHCEATEGIRKRLSNSGIILAVVKDETRIKELDEFAAAVKAIDETELLGAVLVG